MSYTDTPNPIRPLLRPIDAARTLGVSLSTLRRLTAAGSLPSVQISQRRLGYRPADLERLIAASVGGR